jgi:hypothetical protein
MLINLLDSFFDFVLVVGCIVIGRLTIAPNSWLAASNKRAVAGVCPLRPLSSAIYQQFVVNISSNRIYEPTNKSISFYFKKPLTLYFLIFVRRPKPSQKRTSTCPSRPATKSRRTRARPASSRVREHRQLPTKRCFLAPSLKARTNVSHQAFNKRGQTFEAELGRLLHPAVQRLRSVVGHDENTLSGTDESRDSLRGSRNRLLTGPEHAIGIEDEPIYLIIYLF